jgi:hypothetical protein
MARGRGGRGLVPSRIEPSVSEAPHTKLNLTFATCLVTIILIETSPNNIQPMVYLLKESSESL